MLAFAHINWATKLTTSKTFEESVFEGFLTVATFEHSSFDLGQDAFKHLLVIGQLLSVVLYYFVFLPLLVARLALFKGETVSVDNLSNLAHLSVKPLRLKLQADSPVAWTASEAAAGVARAKSFNVDQSGEITVQDTAPTEHKNETGQA